MFYKSLLSLFVASQAVLLTSAAGAPGDNWNPINPNRDTTKCLDVRGGIFADGTPVQIFDCNGSQAQMWSFNAGSTKVNLHGTNFCLDAGSTPGNGVGMKIWTCFEGLAAQQWFYTADKRIALENQGLCLDLTNGVHVNSNRVQTWQCTDNDINQVWTLPTDIITSTAVTTTPLSSTLISITQTSISPSTPSTVVTQTTVVQPSTLSSTVPLTTFAH